jgi:hypothetical protein
MAKLRPRLLAQTMIIDWSGEANLEYAYAPLEYAYAPRWLAGLTADTGHLGDPFDPFHGESALDLDDAQDAFVRGLEPFGVQAASVGAVVGGDAAVPVRGVAEVPGGLGGPVC